MSKPRHNPYFPSLRTIQFLRKSFEAKEAQGKEIPDDEWLYVELWEGMLTDEPIRFEEKFQELKELAF